MMPMILSVTTAVDATQKPAAPVAGMPMARKMENISCLMRIEEKS